MLFLMQSRRLLAAFAASLHCWVMISLLSTRATRSFSCRAAFQLDGLQHVMMQITLSLRPVIMFTFTLELQRHNLLNLYQNIFI